MSSPLTTPLRLVVLASGAGTLLQALLDACEDPRFGAQVVAVGADRGGIAALARAEAARADTFVCVVKDYPTRQAWDEALTEKVAAYEPDLVISAGFLKLVGSAFLARFAGRFLNTHPSLLPAFPGVQAPMEALAYGVRVTGATVFFVDEGVDTGPIVDQRAVPVLEGDTPDTLHERIKDVERAMIVDVVRRMAEHGWTLTGRKVTIG